jgi:hypothetical protein
MVLGEEQVMAGKGIAYDRERERAERAARATRQAAQRAAQRAERDTAAAERRDEARRKGRR